MPRKDAQPGKREAAAVRRVQALELRKTGMPYRRIAEQLGVTEGQAYADVKYELDRIAAEASDLAADVRTIELERLDALTQALWPAATQGDPAAVDRVLRVMERRARLLGIDAPVRQELSGDQQQPLTIRVIRSERANHHATGTDTAPGDDSP